MTPSVEEDKLVGSILDGRFELIRQIGRGAAGKVYLARQLKLDRMVAIKLAVNSALGEGGHERFQREAAALARLSHPNIVQVIDHGWFMDVPYLVMEHVEGVKLSQHLTQEAQLSPVSSLNIARQIAAALSEAHGRGIIHRDLKPDNLLVRRQGNDAWFVKLIDFGLVMQMDKVSELTGDGSLLGTPHYMAPEQCLGNPGAIGPASDLYALGLILYRCLTGRRVFQDRHGAAVMIAHLQEKPPPFKQAAPDLRVPEVVEWTCMRCLEKRPEDRFRDAGELDKALAACLWALRHPDRPLVLGFEQGRVLLPDDIDLEASGSFTGSMVVSVPELLTVESVPAPASKGPLWLAAVFGLIAAIAVGWATSKGDGAATPAPTTPAAPAKIELPPTPTAPPAPVAPPPAPPAAPAAAAPTAPTPAAAPAAAEPPPKPARDEPKPKPAPTPAKATKPAPRPEPKAETKPAPAPSPAPAPAPEPKPSPPSRIGGGSDLKNPWEK